MTKRIFKTLLAFILAIGLITGTFAPVLPVSDYALTVEAKAKKPKLSKAKITLSTGETFKLTVKNASGKFKFSSSNKKVASVDKKGVITAKKNGSTKITAKVGKKKLTCKVSVKKMSIDKKSLSVAAGSTATVTLKNAKNVEWSSNSGIVTVSGNDSSATIKGVKEGKATVSAKAGSVTVKCNVTVTKGSGDNSGDSGSNSSETASTSNVSQPTITYSVVDRQAQRGRDLIGEKINQAVIKFNGFPKYPADIKAIKRGDGNGSEADGKQDGKYLTVACALAAIAAYSEGRTADGKAMMELLLNSPHVSASPQFGQDNFNYDNKREKLPWAFFDGATPENGHKPNQPYTVTIEESVYAPQVSTIYGVSLNIEGIYFKDSTHPCLSNTLEVKVYKDPTDGQWYLWPSGYTPLYHGGSVR